MEQPIGMSKHDITTSKEWRDEQTDRLLAWELLRRDLTFDATPLETTELCDTIGIQRCYISSILKSIKPKLEKLTPPPDAI